MGHSSSPGPLSSYWDRRVRGPGARLVLPQGTLQGVANPPMQKVGSPCFEGKLSEVVTFRYCF
jgi:hypothetical protein